MQEYIGRRLGAYQIVEQIGRGGMATVFKAYQPSMDRYVAIKILPSHLTEDESFVGRFTREARTLARLEHPHILPVHDYGEQEGITYLVMRYVEAGTLKDLIAREGPMALETAAQVMSQVGRALDYAHSQGVVHRDIKPSNILIDPQGNTFLTDFGIAKLVAETAQFTASGAIIGTPAYMSPEQCLAQPVDPRCDIYSLGVVLYELVTGQVPFEAETPVAVLLKHVHDPLPLPRQVVEDLPEAVERVILKAMAKAPEDRFQSVGAMVDALAEAVPARPAESASPPPAEVAAATPLAPGLHEVSTVVDTIPPPAAEATPPPTVVDTTSPPVPGLHEAPTVVDTPPPPSGEATPPPTMVDAAPAPTVVETAPAPAAEATPPPTVVETTPPPTVVETAPAPAAEAAPPRPVTPAPVQNRKRWLLVVGGAALLVLFVVVVFIVWNPLGGQGTPAAVSQTQEAPTAAGQAQATPTAVSQPVAGPSPALPGQVAYPPGWTNYSNSNFVLALAYQGDALWAGGDGGLVRWDVTDGTYTRLGREDGLASTRINDLLVDDEGLLWIATDAGVNRYDGETLITYEEIDGLDAQWIEALFLDGSGGLWAGSQGGERGLNYYDGESWGPPPVPPLPVESWNVQALGGDEQVPLFVGLEDQGLALFDGETWTVLTNTDVLTAGQVVDGLLTDEALWVSSDAALARLDLETGDTETFPQDGIQTMYQTAGGEIWFGGAGRVLRFDPGLGDWQEFEAGPGSIPNRQVTDIAEGEAGLWFGTYGGGVTFFDGSRWETLATDETLGGNWIEAIRQTGDGALWFSHPDTGLSRYEPEGNSWQVFGQPEGVLDWPSFPAVDSEGNLWIGGSGELVRTDGQAWQRFPAPELAEVEIYAIEIDPGDVQWLVTNHGLMRHDPALGEWTTFTGADHPVLAEITSILAASDGNVWVGGEGGLVRYDGHSWSSPVASGTPPQFVDDLAEAADGSLWIAADGRLGHLADGRWSYLVWPPDRWLGRVAVGPDGSVWVGYEGLGRYDPASGDWLLFTPADGLVHQIVHAIYVTAEGVVWVGTEGGVSRYVPPD